MAKKRNLRLTLIGICLTVIMILPFCWGIILSFKDSFQILTEPFSLPKSWDLSPYLDTWRQANIGNLFKNTIVVTVITNLVEIVILFLSSFAISRLSVKHRRFCSNLYYFFLIATAVPLFTILVGVYKNTLALGRIVSFLGIDSIYGLVIPYIAMGVAFSTLMLVGALSSIPVELEEAGIMDGCRLIDVIFRIDFPAVFPMITTLLIFNILGSWNEYVISATQLNSIPNYTLSMAMIFFKSQFSTDYGALMRCIVITTVPQLIFYFIFQKKIVEGVITSGIKG